MLAFFLSMIVGISAGPGTEIIHDCGYWTYGAPDIWPVGHPHRDKTRWVSIPKVLVLHGLLEDFEGKPSHERVFGPKGATSLVGKSVGLLPSEIKLEQIRTFKPGKLRTVGIDEIEVPFGYPDKN